MRDVSTAVVAGTVFGFGLTVSGMVHPAKVLAFLDVAGSWDPSLAFVMGAALVTAAIGTRLALRRAKPLWAARFELPTRTELDARLIGGAMLFGIGWGLGGWCPGPALTGLALGSGEAWLFVAAMAVGMTLHRHLVRPR